MELSNESPKVGYNWNSHNEPFPGIESIWLNGSGTEGWAVCERGVILRYASGKWEEWRKDGQVTTSWLFSLWLNDSGTEGWAVGEGGVILRYAAGKWEEWKKDGQVTTYGLNRVWLNDSGEEGWAVGNNGVILRYISGKWKEWEKDGQPTQFDLYGLWLSDNGTEGWAVGLDVILHYTSGKWVEWEKYGRDTTYWLNSVWLNESGTEGWAVGLDVILHYASGKWEEWRKGGEITGLLNNLWLNDSGTKGWAVGPDVILHYASEKWDKWKEDEQVTTVLLNGLRLNNSGTEGWAVGTGGLILHYASGEWTRWKKNEQVTTDQLNSLWLNISGAEGWAVGDGGVILYYASGKWEEWKRDGQVTWSRLNNLWLNDNGTEGWAVGDSGVILRYTSKKWEEWKKDGQVTTNRLNSLWLNNSGTEGWAVGEKTILRYTSKKWEEWGKDGQVVTRELNDLRLNDSGTAGWAIGDGGVMLHYTLEKWKRERQATVSTLTGLWLNNSGTEGWAVGAEGAILRYSSGRWEKWEKIKQVDARELNSLWLNDSGTEGWAVGNNGVILRYTPGKWEEWKKEGQITMSNLISLQLNGNGTKGWAIGENGTILVLDTVQLASNIEIQSKRIADFEGLIGDHTIQLSFASARPPRIELIEKATGKDILNDSLYTVSTDSVDKQKVLIHFHPAAEQFALRNAHKLCTFRFSAYYESAYAESARISYETDLTLGGRKLWPSWLWLTLGYVSLNILLVVLAVQFSWVRRILLHPYGLPFIIGKYLYTGVLLRFVKPVRLAFFKGFRNHSKNAAETNTWKKRAYVAPTIDGEYSETKWQSVLQDLLKSARKNELFTVIGKSGLGKTALLEKWKAYALEMGQTPFLVRLATDLSPAEEIAAQVEQYGDLALDPATVFDLVKEGGFLILMDGFNEDRTPDRTREFVRQIVKRNTVILTSQFSPSWDRFVTIMPITLEPFGRNQLIPLLGAEWTEKLLGTPYLSDLAELPHTAHLIAAYFQAHKHLPELRLDIYRALRTKLDEDGQTLNLELKAWEMFVENTRAFEPDAKVPPLLCDIAVESGILTRREGKFMFQHERLHRYFVACYLDRQDYQPLESWLAQVEKGLGRTYWSDVIEFLGEIHAERAPTNLTRLTQYKRFILDTVKFEKSIYRERVFPLLSKFKEEGKIALGDDFWEEIAVVLSMG